MIFGLVDYTFDSVLTWMFLYIRVDQSFIRMDQPNKFTLQHETLICLFLNKNILLQIVSMLNKF